MNPQLHDEFVILVPLFYSGELTDEEWALLQVHMAHCDSCREAFEQHQQIASTVIPTMAASAAAESPVGPRESEEKLLAEEQRLISRLKPRSSPALVATHGSKWTWIVTGAIAAGFAGVLVYAGLQHLHLSTHQGSASNSTVEVTKPIVPVPKVISGTSADQNALIRDNQKVQSLESQLSAQAKQSAQSEAAVAEEKRRLQTEETQQQQLVAQRDTLNQQLETAQADVQSLRNQLTNAEGGVGQQTARVAELEAKLQRLNSALDDANAALDAKDKMLAFDKDLMLHDRDIRDVIGARNLYIADIYDTTANGATAKPFGRIFYTKDSSLVFYGFDLDKQSGVKQSVSFQAWGSSTDHRPVSLGLFGQDDSHKRWVLKCNDAATLARLNMVFVTVEPPGGSTKPTGKQFLRAYLQIQPNHP